MDEGERVIRALCRHPSTAQFVATKLVTHFVSDEPPAAAVDRVARVFRRATAISRPWRVRSSTSPRPGARTRASSARRRTGCVAVLRAFGAGDASANAPVAAATAATAVLVARGAERIRRRPAGVGRSRFAAQSRRAGAHDLETAGDAATRPAIARSTSWTCPPGEPAARDCWPTPPISAPERIALAIAGPAFQWR